MLYKDEIRNQSMRLVTLIVVVEVYFYDWKIVVYVMSPKFDLVSLQNCNLSLV